MAKLLHDHRRMTANAAVERCRGQARPHHRRDQWYRPGRRDGAGPPRRAPGHDCAQRDESRGGSPADSRGRRRSRGRRYAARRSGFAIVDSTGGRKSARPISNHSCARQQRRRRIRHEAAESGWHRADLGGQPPGPFLLTTLLLERLEASAPARIVTTSSAAHQGARIPFDDMNAERSWGRSGFPRYGETKLANILFTAELARRIEGTGVTANAFHPGFAASRSNRDRRPLG